MSDATPPPTARSGRLLSLDVFRGFDIAAMIIVNMTWDSEQLSRQLFHVGWNGGLQGVTFTDLVFPWFLFIAGLSLPFSMRSGRGRALTAWQRVSGAGRRALIIYSLGLILDAASSGQFRFFKWNILQIIGGAYFIAAVLAQMPRWVSVVFVAAVLLGKWYILSVAPHPEYGEPVWNFQLNGAVVPDRYTPGAVAVNGEQVIASRLLAAEPGLPLSGFIGYGPLLGWLTGMFNLLPAAVVVVLGGFTGTALADDDARRPRTGAVLVGIGLAGWGVSWLWNLHHPWSKDFFTASYALLAASTGAGLIGLLYLLLDTAWRWKAWLGSAVLVVGAAGSALCIAFRPGMTWVEWAVGLMLGGCLMVAFARARPAAAFFRILGMNAIAVYFVNELLFKMVFSRWTLPVLEREQPMAGALHGLLRSDWIAGSTLDLIIGSMAFAVLWLCGCFLLALTLYRRGIFVRV
jgi:predicted acyltransferase